MPKSSLKSKSELPNPPKSSAMWVLKYAPYEIFVITGLLALGLNYRIWLLEAPVSFVPQILILVAAYLLVYATLATRQILMTGTAKLLADIGRLRISVMALGLLMGVYVLAVSVSILPGMELSRRVAASGLSLTIGTYNKLYSNTNFLSDSGVISATQADVFSLQEVRAVDLALIKKSVDHEYSYITECECSAKDTEVGIISRYPITNARTIYEHQNSTIVRVVIDSDQHGEFIVYAVHMHVPYQSSSYDLRDDAFRLLSDSISAETLPTFVVGDMNTTIFSPDMQNFMSGTPKVANVTTRAWPQCSWFGYGELTCSRIDYVFVPSGADVYSLEIGDEGGSDHRSVVVELSI